MIAEIVREIERHGIRVDLRSPVSADDDLGRITGSKIVVVTDQVETVTAFTLCHLFGHMVQFTNMDRYKYLIEAVSPAPPVLLSAEFWQEFYAYEREAFAYGAWLLENATLTNDALCSQYATFMELDFEHFREYVSSGNRMDRKEFRTSLLRRYESNTRTVPITPLPAIGTVWRDLGNVEAIIY